LKIGVGSMNPNKVKSVENVMKKIYTQEHLEVIGLNINSKISSQPFNGETIEGAINRSEEVIHKVLQGKEVGDVMDEFVGIENVGKKMWAIGILSKGIINRSDLTQQAVLTANDPKNQ
jgi:non-canonical (house-cleaning) NTP pyrophosphatase